MSEEYDLSQLEQDILKKLWMPAGTLNFLKKKEAGHSFRGLRMTEEELASQLSKSEGDIHTALDRLREKELLDFPLALGALPKYHLTDKAIKYLRGMNL